MLNNSMPVALITNNQAEVTLFTIALAEAGFRKVTSFTSGKEAYELVTRQQFPIFITRMEMPDMTGIVLIQKLRLTGNYGLEPHLFVCNKLDGKLLNVMAEHDLEYAMVPPLNKQTILQKIKHMIDTENKLNPAEKLYRDAKSAYGAGILDMAESHVRDVLTGQPNLEKAIILLGDIVQKGGNLDGAQQAYKQALSVNPKSTTALHKLAQVMMAKGDFKSSADLLDKLATVSPYNIKLLENAGLSNYNAERYDQAAVHMSVLSTLDEDNKTAATVTAQVKIKKGDYSGLVNGLGKAMEDKELIQFLNNAGAKLASENQIDAAIKMYQSAIDQIKASKFLYAIHFNLGLAFKKKDVKDKALTHFERSAKLNPEFSKASQAIEELKKSA